MRPRRPVMRILLVWLAVAVVAACEPISPELQSALDEQQAQIKKLSGKLEELDKKLADSVTLVTCAQDVRQMFEQVRSECSRAGMCGTAQIKAANSLLDPERRPNFFRHIRSNFIHEVIYVATNQNEIKLDVRQDRLAKFAGIPLFRNTRILIIASDHVSQQDAQTRAKVVTDALINLKFPAELIDVWPYGFKLSKIEISTLRNIDKPQFGEPDFPFGVWVFRVDCSLGTP